MARLVSWLTEGAGRFGPWGLFLVALADSSFVPLPQAVDTLIIGHTIASPPTAYWGAALAVAGSLVGSLMLYGISRGGAFMVIKKRVSSRTLTALRRQLDSYGALVLFPPTVLPVPLPMTPFVIAAGVFQMSVWHFTTIILLGRSVRYFGEAFITLRYGDRTIAFIQDNAMLAVLLVALVVGLFYAIHRWSWSRLGQS